MEFLAMVLKLQPVCQQRPLAVADSIYAHAAIINAITRVDPVAGQILHDIQRHKPLGIAIVESSKSNALLRVVFMTQQATLYANTLINALEAESEIQLGRTRQRVVGVDLTDPDWALVNTWADLTRQSSQKRIRFRFATPTAFTKRDDAGKRAISLYPEPLDVFAGLVRRWTAFNGPDLPEVVSHIRQDKACVVSRHNLRTVEFRNRERTQIGFVGEAVYQCQTSDPALVSSLNALARLARFTGVGYQTARGMGAVQVTLGG